MGRAGPQAIAGAATTSMVVSEPEEPGQRGPDSYHEADELTAGEHTTDLTSSDDIVSPTRGETPPSQMTSTSCLSPMPGQSLVRLARIHQK